MATQSSREARLAERTRAQEREAIEARDRDHDAERRARVIAKRGALHNSLLPNFPVDMLEGFRLFWGVTNSQYDPIEGRLQEGYVVVQREELPAQYRSMASEQQTSGQYGNAIVVREHILLKIKTEIWQDAMWVDHHDEPYGFLHDTITNAQELAQSRRGGKLVISDDMRADADRRYQTPHFS